MSDVPARGSTRTTRTTRTTARSATSACSCRAAPTAWSAQSYMLHHRLGVHTRASRLPRNPLRSSGHRSSDLRTSRVHPLSVPRILALSALGLSAVLSNSVFTRARDSRPGASRTTRVTSDLIARKFFALRSLPSRQNVGL
ncbi:hypothetical protein OH76DRAFT_1412041, partial [Lentinus brumalis]